MGAIKKMVEKKIPGIYVLSLEIGKTMIEVRPFAALFREGLLTGFMECAIRRLHIAFSAANCTSLWMAYMMVPT